MGNIFYSPPPQALPPPPVPLFVYECDVINSKKRKCFRAKVYKVAEKYHAEFRPGSSDGPDGPDGITYDNDNLKVKLVFRDIRDCQDFQSAVREIPLHYRKRSRNLPEDDLMITDSVTKINVPESLISNLKRVFYNDYQPISDDPNRSGLCDTASDFTDRSYVSDVFVTEEVRLKLVDAESSTSMFLKKPEKCHLKSQSTFKELKNDPNNIVYMSRQLHEYFDGIGQTDGVPAFVMTYKKHDPQVITRVFDDDRTLHVYETTVSVLFRTELIKSILSPFFKDHRDVTTKRIEFCLYFEEPEDFEEYAAFKASETRAKWASLAGPESAFDD